MPKCQKLCNIGGHITAVTEFCFSCLSLIGCGCIVDYLNDVWNSVDLWLANGFTQIWDRYLERKATAPMTIVSDQWIVPHKEIAIDRQRTGHKIQLIPQETWLTDESIDYSLFWRYRIDAKAAQDALSKVLSKIPVIGGHWYQISADSIGIDFSDPRIHFTYAQTVHEPSIDYKDHDKEHYYMKYTNGANKLMPFPDGKAVFKVTLVHYPNPGYTRARTNENGDADADGDGDGDADADGNENEEKYDGSDHRGNNNTNNNDDEFFTLIAIGCSHALCDGEALFTLLRCWASELRGESYAIPEFNRRLLFVKDAELQAMDAHTEVLGKHVGHSFAKHGWFVSALWPARRWQPYTWHWTKAQMDALKKHVMNHGRAAAQLTEIKRISSNDVLTALYWKLNATLNSGYEFHRPIINCMVINTRKWIPNRFPKLYFGNGIAFLLLSCSRGELIECDLSEVVLKVRLAVLALKSEMFEADLHFYTHMMKSAGVGGVKHLHRCQGRWAVNAGRKNTYWHSHYLHNRDMMVSNLMKLDTHNIDMGRGHPSCVRFNHRNQPTIVSYLFKCDPDGKQYEFYAPIPTAYKAFFDKYDIRDPNLNWDEINANYVKEPNYWFREYPWPRCCRIHPKHDYCEDRKDKKKNWFCLDL